MLSEQKYASIGTKKHNGNFVWTPVWMTFVESKNAYYLFSAGAAGKVKRVRNYADIQVAPCTVSGKITGPAAGATAGLEDDEGISTQAYQALRAKYGWQMAVLDFFSKLSGNYHKRQLIGFSLSNPAHGETTASP
jgi:PPOX class probable F420-dependent enzyme